MWLKKTKMDSTANDRFIKKEEKKQNLENKT